MFQWYRVRVEQWTDKTAWLVANFISRRLRRYR